MKIMLGLAALALPATLVLPVPSSATQSAPVTAARAAAPAAAVPAMCEGLAPTLVGTEGDDVLRGTPGADVVVGLGGDDVLRGLGGADVLCGGEGGDRLVGGPGADRLLGQADGVDEEVEEELGEQWPVGDLLVGGPGADYLDTGAGSRGDFFMATQPNIISYRSADRGVDVRLRGRVGTVSGQGRDQVRNRQDVLVLGTQHGDRMRGGRGSQTFVLGRGDDEAVTGAGSDLVVAGGRGERDRVRLGSAPDLLVAEGGDHVVASGPGSDFSLLLGGRASLASGDGNDTVVAVGSGRAAYRLLGGKGTDGLHIEGASGSGTSFLDLATGALRMQGAGSSRAIGFEGTSVEGGRWEVHGTAGGDSIYGGSGIRAFGRGGDDNLVGSSEDDLLDGGPGVDEVHGGGGEDTCRAWEEGACQEESGEEGFGGWFRTGGRLEQGPRWLSVVRDAARYDVEVGGVPLP